MLHDNTATTALLFYRRFSLCRRFEFCRRVDLCRRAGFHRRVDFHGRIDFRKGVVLRWDVGTGDCYCRMTRRNREPTATRFNRYTCYTTRMIEGQPGAFDEIEKTYQNRAL